MKKNLRIVSAAAAALLAVAPVAAAAVVSPASAVVTSAKAGDTVSTNTEAWEYLPKYSQVKNVSLTGATVTGKPVEGVVVQADGKTADIQLVPVTKDGKTYYAHYKGFGTGTNDNVNTDMKITGAAWAYKAESNSYVRIPNKSVAKGTKVQVNGDTVKDAQLPRGKRDLVPVVVDGKTVYLNSKNLDSVADNSGKNDNSVNSTKILNSELRAVDANGKVVYLPTNTHLTVSNNGKSVTVNDTDSQYNGQTFTVNADALKKALAKPTAAKDETPSESVNSPRTSIYDADGNTEVTFAAVAAEDGRPSAVSGKLVATIGGTDFTALLHGSKNTTIYERKNGKYSVVPDQNALRPRKEYFARLRNVTVNLGNKYAGSTQKFTLTRGWFEKNSSLGTYSDPDGMSKKAKNYRTLTVKVDNNGVANLGRVWVPFYAYDATNLQELHFYSMKTGNIVTSGSVDLHAVNGQLNVESIEVAMRHEYAPSQVEMGLADARLQPVAIVNDLRDQLKKQNITVDDHGYFKAPSSFTVNMNAASILNGAKASLPVTVNVDNAAAQTPANEQTTTKTIMHISTIYDKNGNATKQPALRAYNSVSVVSTPVTINGAKFYKLAGKDEYIKVGNIDGTGRHLRHNAYVYKANGKAIKVSKKHHKVLKNGANITTFGKSFKNDVLGTQVYRIGRNQYVKVANFR